MESMSTPLKTSKNPWNLAATSPVLAVDLSDVMSEQLAAALQEDENKKGLKSEIPKDLDFSDSSLLDSFPDPFSDFNSDEAIARVLQNDFIHEQNQLVSQMERQMNEKSKVMISLSNFKGKLPEEYKELSINSNDETSEMEEMFFPQIGRNGISGHGKNILTKHDLDMCGKQNGLKLMDMTSDIETGLVNFTIPNRSLNILKEHGKNMMKRDMHAKDRKDKDTCDEAIDTRTLEILQKLVTRDSLSQLLSAVGIGKEARVYHASNENGSCAIKIYKTIRNDFKDRTRYLDDEYRYYGNFHQNGTSIDQWVEKEVQNLSRLDKAGIPCPKYISHKNHVLVMEFIGTDNLPAPRLKEAQLTKEEWVKAYTQSIAILERIYKHCELVHADLSEYNLLWHDNHVWIIDLGQGVVKLHPLALDYLYRDCNNITNFFVKKGVEKVQSSKSLFTSITNLDFEGEGKVFESKIQKYGQKKADQYRMRLNKRQSLVDL